MAPLSSIVLANQTSSTFFHGAPVASLYLRSQDILHAEQWLSQSISPRPSPSPLELILRGWYTAVLIDHPGAGDFGRALLLRVELDLSVPYEFFYVFLDNIVEPSGRVHGLNPVAGNAIANEVGQLDSGVY